MRCGISPPERRKWRGDLAVYKLASNLEPKPYYILLMLNKMPVDDKVLSYFDVVLRQGDVDLLTGPNWLNDQLLAFYFEFLAREQFRDISEVLLIPGAATYLLTSSGAF